MKKICFITTSRADFGTLNELIKEVIKEKFFSVQLIISGSHTSKIFGKTEKEINKKNCLIKKIKVSSQNKNSISALMLTARPPFIGVLQIVLKRRSEKSKKF